ncbi:hypothetical protein C3K47_15570 [Solitalea longa]|uniref:Uncharacterized protein n=1 Tax=Solitalea longa TaxID=2079460 RepID=A0A2S4ZZN3_9SPHI|nr:hypothetical protein [Solitalea longa]POY35477.1 hypothetical protein C3K47_15570 [Solitalea longa]
MKLKHLLSGVLLFFATIIIGISSCKKEDPIEIDPDKPIIDQVKTWYSDQTNNENSFSKNEAQGNSEDFIKDFVQQNKPYWKLAIKAKTRNGTDYMALPVYFDKVKGVYRELVINVIDNKLYGAIKEYSLSTEAHVMDELKIYSLSGRLIEKGKITRKGYIPRKTHKNSDIETQAIGDEIYELPEVTVTSTYTGPMWINPFPIISPPSYLWWTYTEVYNSPATSGGSWYSYVEPEMKDEDWVQYWNYYNQSDILNNISNPCVKQAVDEAISQGLKNEIIQTLYSQFNINDDINLRFYESPMDPEVDGHAEPVKINSTWNVDIYLNDTTLPLSSKEYVAATVYHEAIHAILRVKGKDDILDHYDMALSCIEEMSIALHERFPDLPYEYAEALAWGGLQETISWVYLQTHYPQKAQFILQINQKYKNQTYGTPICN